MSGKALEMEHLFLYTDCVRGTWREGSYNEDSEVHVIEGSGNGAFLLHGSTMGT
jgi:hypothetical protein